MEGVWSGESAIFAWRLGQRASFYLPAIFTSVTAPLRGACTVSPKTFGSKIIHPQSVDLINE